MKLTGHPDAAVCAPHLYKPYDLNDDFVKCSVCGQGWTRAESPDSWGPFTVMAED